MQLVIGNVNSIQKDPPFAWRVESRKEAEHCCLAGAGCPNDSHDLPGFYIQRDVPQRVLSSLVGESDVFICHSSQNMRDLPGVICVSYFGGCIEYIKCTL